MSPVNARLAAIFSRWGYDTCFLEPPEDEHEPPPDDYELPSPF